MLPPSKSEATGYDIVVWVDHEGDIVARGFSKVGHTALKAFVNKYRAGDIVQIYCNPEEFIDELTSNVRVGVLSSRTGEIGPFATTRLQ